jgi:hypothetical protein
MPSLSQSTYLEYDKFSKMIDNTPPYHLYEEMMAKEDKVLDSLNRFANIKHNEETQIENTLKSTSGFNLVRSIAKTNYEVFRDLMSTKDVWLLYKTLTPERLVHLGITVLTIAVFMVLVMLST